MYKPCIIVHGGAANIPENVVANYNEGTKKAARAGYDCLMEGSSAVDAVEKAVNALEDDSTFNAGHGSCLTEAGTVETDAMIMDGSNLKIGAVACVTGIANPVSLARKVKERTSHCLIVADGALKFAKKINFPLLENASELITKESMNRSFAISENTYDAHLELYMNKVLHSKEMSDLRPAFEEILKKQILKTENVHDTVGAVAMDTRGNIACATSTGGIPGKMLGRVGDSPLVGGGGYANKVGGSSSTGHGESLMKTLVTKEALQYLEEGLEVNIAAQKAVDKCLELTNGRGGVIMIDNKGNIGYAHTTSSMAWASITADSKRFGLRLGDAKDGDF